jgi:hypothetical protein
MPKRSAAPKEGGSAQLAALLLGDKTRVSALPNVTLDLLLQRSSDELGRAARRLGLSGVSRLRKQDLARRVREALRKLASPAGRKRAAGKRAEPEPETGARSKFDLGSRVPEPAPRRHIPWGYAQDRITALVLDPRRLYAYWEVRDDAIETARRALGPGGRDAWLNLRVYDVSGRIFDGTNAHSYFDVKVDRDTRQWFFDIGKPTSSHCVEVGLKSY